MLVAGIYNFSLLYYMDLQSDKYKYKITFTTFARFKFTLKRVSGIAER